MVAKHSQTILFLENGDRLTRAEFERRYSAMPHLKKDAAILASKDFDLPVNAEVRLLA